MNYDVDYFIKKFEAIPDEKWTTENFKEGMLFWAKYCALGHCGMREGGHCSEEGSALLDLFIDTSYDVASVNDGHTLRYNQKTPKQRVLALLNDLKHGLLKPHGFHIVEENFKPQEEVLEIV